MSINKIIIMEKIFTSTISSCKLLNTNLQWLHPKNDEKDKNNMSAFLISKIKNAGKIHHPCYRYFSYGSIKPNNVYIHQFIEHELWNLRLEFTEKFFGRKTPCLKYRHNNHQKPTTRCMARENMQTANNYIENNSSDLLPTHSHINRGNRLQQNSGS